MSSTRNKRWKATNNQHHRPEDHQLVNDDHQDQDAFSTPPNHGARAQNVSPSGKTDDLEEAEYSPYNNNIVASLAPETCKAQVVYTQKEDFGKKILLTVVVDGTEELQIFGFCILLPSLACTTYRRIF